MKPSQQWSVRARSVRVHAALLILVLLASFTMAPHPVLSAPALQKAAPDFTDLMIAAESWDDRFGIPGLTANVNALAVQGSDLYVGGVIFSTGLAERKALARWDGRRWHDVGGGVDSGAGQVGAVYALLAAGGKLYAGGEFKRAGGVAANNIAVWDGVKWSALGAGVTGDVASVRALAMDPQGNLYVGGSFTKAGNVTVAGIAKWNGSAWSALGEGLNQDFGPGTVHALTWWNGKLYAGGEFSQSQSGGAALNGVAAWNGSSWEALGDGVKEWGFAGTVYSLEAADSQLYVGGSFEEAGAAPANNVAAWNGASWSTLGDGLGLDGSSETVFALETANGRLYAGGDFTVAGGQAANRIAYWQGGAWHPLEQNDMNGVGTDFSGKVAALAALGTDVYAAGEFELAADMAVNHVAAWTGSGWRALGQGLGGSPYGPGLLNAVAVGPGGVVYVGGLFDYAGGVPVKNIAMWDGTRWHALGQGADDWVFTIKIVGNEVYVGGDFTAAGGQAATHIAKWDHAGKAWSPLGSGVSARVADIDIDGDWVYAGGNFTAAGGMAVSKAAKWNRTAKTWANITTDPIIIDNPVYAIDADGPDVFLGGDFGYITKGSTDIEVNSLVWWSATNQAWFALDGGVERDPSDLNGWVWDLLVVGNSMYVTGLFDKVGDVVAAQGIARYDFDGSGWSALTSGLGGGAISTEGYALALHGPDVLVSGEFKTAGGVVTNHIARWSPASQQWSALGAGMSPVDDAEVQDVVSTGAEIYAVGFFEMAGGLPSSSFARYTSQIVIPDGPKVYLPLITR